MGSFPFSYDAAFSPRFFVSANYLEGRAEGLFLEAAFLSLRLFPNWPFGRKLSTVLSQVPHWAVGVLLARRFLLLHCPFLPFLCVLSFP